MTDWADEKPTIELVKQTITVPEVAELLGFEPNSQDKIPSFANPDERTPSLHLYEDHYWDFSTGEGGDVIDFLRAADPSLTLDKALWKLWNKALRAGKEPGDVEKRPVRQVMDFRSQLPLSNDMALFHWEAKLGVRIPRACRVLDGNLLIPHQDAEGVYGVKVRGADGAKTAWPGSQFTKRLYSPDGWPLIDRAMDDLILCEGESDSWALLAAMNRYPTVVALPSGASAWKDHWLQDLEPYKTIYLCMDNDRAGNEARDKITRKIGHLRAEQLRVPPLYNDVREAIRAGWQPVLPGQ